MSDTRAILQAALPARLRRRLRAILWRLRPPEPELALVAPLADPTRTFLDVGANNGAYLEPALGRFAALYAVEPDPELADYLKTAFSGQVTVLPLALSQQSGTMLFYLPYHDGRAVKTRGSLEPTANPGLEQATRTIEVATLDALDLPPLGLVKIDVEGHELAVLEGGLRRLRRDRPRLLVEIEERHHPDGSDRVVELLDSLGYEAFYMAGSKMKPLGNTKIRTLQNLAHSKSITQRDKPVGQYINNFLFLHHEDIAAREALRNDHLFD